MRDILVKMVGSLRHIEKNASLVSKSYRDQTRRERERLEKLADMRPGSSRVSLAKFNAVHFAYHLLANFGKGPPGLSREGPWHRLAGILFGDVNADLFEYLEYYKRLESLPPPDPLIWENIAPFIAPSLFPLD